MNMVTTQSISMIFLLAGRFDVWASRGTLEGLGINRRSHILKANQQQKIGDWLVKPLPLFTMTKGTGERTTGLSYSFT